MEDKKSGIDAGENLIRRERQHKNWIIMLWNFMRFGKCKWLCIRTFFLAGYFRHAILKKDPEVLHRTWGKRGEESALEVSEEAYRYAGKVGYAVEMVCERTPWESKCLVKALCAQYFLTQRKISSTLYLGCGVGETGEMLAHAWIRCGSMYVTGGDGMGYAVVDCYAKGQGV